LYLAVPGLMERLNDPDRLVRFAVITQVADFGPIAAGAIPHLAQWLDSQEESLRVLP
jgi:hypothetical protein